MLIKQIEPDFELVEYFATTVHSINNAQQQGLPIKLIDELDNNVTINDKQSCVISPVWQLKGVFFEALTAFITVLERYTLADIITNKVELEQLLS